MENKKLFYSISEASTFLDLPANTLRYWETEFSVLAPAKNRGNNRVYSKKDIEIAEKIKFLLHEERFTIEGAVKVMKKLKSIPLETYKRTRNLILDKNFLADFEKLCEVLKKINDEDDSRPS
jgi:DNA-binding transcriptional MerR regulator